MKKANVILCALVLALPLAACGDDDGGPIDGTYTLSNLSCDSVDATMMPQLTLNVNNTTGTFQLGFGPDCVANIDEEYSYSGDTITITPTAVSCSPNTGCAAIFGGADCMPLPPPTDFTYALNGNTLTFSKTSGGPPADNCPAGATELYTMSKQ